MKNLLKSIVISTTMLLSFNVMADPDIDDVSIEVMENSNDHADAVMEHIELPDQASEVAEEASEHGMEHANAEHGPDGDNDDAADHQEAAENHQEEAENHQEEAENHQEEAENHPQEDDDHGPDHANNNM